MGLPPKFYDTPRPFRKGSSGDCLVQALASRGIAYRYLSRDEVAHPHPRYASGATVLTFEINGERYYFDGGRLRVTDPSGLTLPGPVIDSAAARIVRKKDLVLSVLREEGISVPEGAAFDRNEQRKAEAFFVKLSRSLPNGVCVKPAVGRQGRYVHVGVRDLSTFRGAFAAASEYESRVLVEEAVSGGCYRFLCLAGRAIAIELCLPSNVEGDGMHTITELVALKNAERSLNSTHATYPIQLGPQERLFLYEAGLKPNDAPEAGRQVFLCKSFNWLRGGEVVDATEIVHPSYIELVERAISLFPGLIFCGPDVVIEDARMPASKRNYHILEINFGPGFAAHHNPWRGTPRDVSGAIIDYLIKRERSTQPDLGVHDF